MYKILPEIKRNSCYSAYLISFYTVNDAKERNGRNGKVQLNSLFRNSGSAPEIIIIQFYEKRNFKCLCLDVNKIFSMSG